MQTEGHLMKYFLPLFIIFTFPLFAVVDRSACIPSGDFLATSDTSAGEKDFLKICLPNEREDAAGINTVTGLKNANIKGGLLMIGNQVLCAMDNTVSTSECIDPNSKEYFSGGSTDGCADSGSNDGCQNNDFQDGPDTAYLGLADYDDNITHGISAAEANTTASSTMANLTLKAGDTVLWAKLYWMGRTDSSTDADYANVKDVKLLTPTTGGAYQDITCTHYGDTGDEYYCAAEVTQMVSQSGEYWVGNVPGHEEASNNFAAWSLMVVYQNDVDPFTNVAIYEGFGRFASGSDPLDIPLTGFLTPVAGAVEATFHVLAGESDNGYADQLTVTDKAGVAHLVENPVGTNTDFLNATISRYGVISTDRLPAFNNALGIDIDSNELNWMNSGTLEPILDNNQSTTTLSFSSTSDELFVPVVGFTTEIFQPDICYDYSYYQNNRSFTEDNNGSLNVVPHILGDGLSTTDPITVRLMLKNMEPESFAYDVDMSIKDINITGEVSYDGNLQRTLPGGLIYSPLTPTSSSSSTVNYPITDSGVGMGTAQIVYSQFDVMPSSSTVDVPLDMSISFSISLSGGITLDYDGLKLKDDIPLCTSNNFSYHPVFGIFNVLDHSLYNATGKYNLFTQVSNRKFDIDIVSNDPDDLTVEYNLSTIVGVEMIDVGGFHDTNASCMDPGSAITEKVYVTFDNNVSKVAFDVDQAIIDELTDLTNSDDFYKVARENVAFRISYEKTNDGNDDLVQLTKKANGDFTVDNFTQLVQDVGTCKQEVLFNKSTANMTWNVATACGNAGTSGVNPWELKQCLKCLYGVNTSFICSRDNFSIRPEALNLEIYDRNVTSGVQNIVPNVIGTDATISAGYAYKFDINATNHLDNNATPGYTQNFFGGTDHNITYEWEPNGRIVTGCNDITDHDINGSLKDGSVINLDGINKNVGRYNLKMIDSQWTKADQNPDHHVGNDLYLNSTNGGTENDCNIDQDDVSLYVNGGNYADNMVGCTIKSEHKNLKANTQFHDYNVSVRPFDFNVAGIQFHRGSIDTNTSVTNQNAYVYNNRLATYNALNVLVDDINMSIRYTGRLGAVGADNFLLTNFVKDCYAETLDLDVDTSLIPVNGPNYTFNLRERYYDMNTSTGDINTSIGDVNASVINNDIVGLDYSLIDLIALPANNFYKDMNGSAIIELNLNFDRDVNETFNPITLIYRDLNVSCETHGNCKSIADLEAEHHPEGIVVTDLNVTHLYGRAHTPRHRVQGPNATVPIYYEFFCDTALVAPEVTCNIADLAIQPSPGVRISPFGLLSPDDIRWYSQTLHNVGFDGAATFTQTRTTEDYANFGNGAGMAINGTLNAGVYAYGGQKGYPYKVTIDVMTPDWLIYNRYDGSATINNFGNNVNSFELEFTQAGNWAGQDRSGMGTESNASATTNRRIQW